MNNNNNNNNSSSGTSGVRITRRSARNWITLVSKEASTPKSSKKEVAGIASKYLTGVEDEAAVKKLSAKREKDKTCRSPRTCSRIYSKPTFNNKKR
uniref:Candidate secreted effector n=1 Tax=Meloidogyne incognita TaxID=6306 RepID=A0A914N6W2_MELIC